MSSALVNSADQYIGVGFFYDVAHHKRVSRYLSGGVTSGSRVTTRNRLKMMRELSRA
jgi:hypothetical protein